jgi:hypothetical protein
MVVTVEISYVAESYYYVDCFTAKGSEQPLQEAQHLEHLVFCVRLLSILCFILVVCFEIETPLQSCIMFGLATAGLY